MRIRRVAAGTRMGASDVGRWTLDTNHDEQRLYDGSRSKIGVMPKKKTKRTNAPREMPKSSEFELDTGLLLIIASVLIFIIGGYAVLFSAFLPLTGIPVSERLCSSYGVSHFGADSGCNRDRYPLQILRVLDHSHGHILRYCELGGVAVLSKLLKTVISSR